MRALLDFFVRHGAWFVFAILAAVSCFFLFNGNPLQRAVALTSAGRLTSGVYSAATSVTGYFHLRDINDDLQKRVASLELENINLRQRLRRAGELAYADSLRRDSASSQFSFVVGRVINNSIIRPNNFITIDRGSADGLEPEMGVVDRNGVVGIVNVVGPHASRVISLLNPDMKLSCKIRGTEAFGSLVWDGQSSQFAMLEEIPEHLKVGVGDTVVTSGFSTTFPEGIPVGIIKQSRRNAADNSYSLKVQLMTDFATLSTVRIIRNYLKAEIDTLETDRVNTSGKIQ